VTQILFEAAVYYQVLLIDF